MGTTVVATQASTRYEINLEDAPHTSAQALGDILNREHLIKPILMRVYTYPAGLVIEFVGYRVRKDGTVGKQVIDVSRSSVRAPALPDWAQVIVERVQALRFEMLTMYTTAGDEQ